MNEISNPLDYLIQCCEIAITTGKWKLNKFNILNAKDELQKLRQVAVTFRSLRGNRWLSCEKELVSLKEKINLIFSKPVAYGLINDRHDLYNLTLHYNRFLDKDDKLIPLYSNREEFLNKDWNNGKSTK